MERKGFVRTLVIVLAGFFLLTAAGVARADFYWETIQETRGVAGHADKSELIKTYFTADATRIESEDKVVIINYDTMMLYWLNPDEKTYMEMDLRRMPEMPGATDTQRARIGRLKKRLEERLKHIEVISTNETKTIAGYKCYKVLMRRMMTTTEYWISKDVPGFDELKQISAKIAEKLHDNPLFGFASEADLITRLGGFPVQTIAPVGEGTRTTTLKHIEERSLDKQLFEVPKDYRLTSK